MEAKRHYTLEMVYATQNVHLRHHDLFPRSANILTYASPSPAVCLFSPLPLFHLPLLRQLAPHNLIAVQQTKRIIRLLQTPHCINRARPQLMLQIIALDQANAMLARRRTFELDGALDHVVDDVFGFCVLGLLVVEDDC